MKAVSFSRKDPVTISTAAHEGDGKYVMTVYGKTSTYLVVIDEEAFKTLESIKACEDHHKYKDVHIHHKYIGQFPKWVAHREGVHGDGVGDTPQEALNELMKEEK